MKPTIIEDIASLLKGRLMSEIMTVFPDTLFPILNTLVKDFASVPSEGAFFLNDEYFLNTTFTGPPTLNAELGYAEVMMNGLVYSKSTQKTTAVHDITPATRDLKA